MGANVIRIGGAREHNLKNLSLNIPRDQLVVVTGLSGSGKSSLAFDTIYAEGQRKYVESLSAYARQFLDQMQKPELDFIEGLSPTIAIEQRSAGGSMRSIIATTTEIFDYLRLLYAHVATPHCPESGEPMSQQTPTERPGNVFAQVQHLHTVQGTVGKGGLGRLGGGHVRHGLLWDWSSRGNCSRRLLARQSPSPYYDPKCCSSLALNSSIVKLYC